jgi:lysophospholipase L1-like esterase
MKKLKRKYLPISGLAIIGTLIILWGFHWKIDGPSIYLIGDSTMAERTESVAVNPERGWGQALHYYFKDEVHIHNHAVNGRSTRSFIDEGRWQKVLAELKPGDFVFIQFGHNDQKINDPKRYTNPTTAYYNNLLRFVKETREKKATPVLLTSIVRRRFNEQGTLIDTHGLYPLIVRQLAQNQDVLFIDHLSMTEKFVAELGEEKSKEWYVWVPPGQYAKFKEGKKDDTHLMEKGAADFAKMVAKELVSMDTVLKKFIVLN